MAHIFISYSTINRDYATQLADKLRDEGFDVWIDNAELRSGENWPNTIFKAVRSCAAFIVIMTPESKESTWVEREVILADNQKKPTYPLLLDGDNWDFFVQTQFENVTDGQLPGDKFYENLAQIVPRKSEQGEDVTEKHIDTLPDGTEIRKAIKNPPPKDEELVSTRSWWSSLSPPVKVALIGLVGVLITFCGTVIGPIRDYLNLSDRPPGPTTPYIEVVFPVSARSAPGVSSEIAQEFVAGERVDVLGVTDDGEWYLISLPDGGEGWVASSAARIQVFGDDIPVVTVVPTLTPTNTPTPTFTATDTATYTPMATSTATPTPINTATNTPTATWTLTHTLRPTDAVTATSTSIPLSTAVSTTFGGGQGQIVFTSDRDGNPDIYVMDVNGGNQTQITANSAVNGLAIWSPDGSQIAFVSDRNYVSDASREAYTYNEIYVMNADGSNIRQLTNNTSLDSAPSWSPDGEHIVFYSFRDGNEEIYVIDADDGGNPRRLTNHDAVDWAPSWSPDGQRIAFVSRRHSNIYDSIYDEIYVMDADGGNVRRITFNDSTDRRPMWSPDGQFLVFMSQRPNESAEIYIINADGSNERRLTNNDSVDRLPDWSPNGEHIIFVSDRDGDEEIYIMDIDGGNIQQVTNNSANDYAPAWRP